jgi:hypothetical protein
MRLPMYLLNHCWRVVVILLISLAQIRVHTKDDLAAIKDTNHLISRSLVMVYLQQFYSSATHRKRSDEMADLAERNPGIPGKLLLPVHQGVSPLSNQTT